VKIVAGPSESVVKHLLAESGLPTADITPDKLATFFAADDDGRVPGVVGLELHGRVGLLRSLAVDSRHRSAGLGSALVAHAEAFARSRGVTALYLLTTTAAAFFRRRGYEPIPRALAPPEIQATSEFGRLCPASAVLMIKRL
jgi:amino-acid N-acetyltransferase